VAEMVGVLERLACDGVPVQVVGDLDGAPIYTCGWDDMALALRCSATTRGQWWWSNDGLSWVRGSHAEYAVRADAVEAVRAARDVCHALGVAGGYSVGGCARALLRWVGERKGDEWRARRAVADRFHFYRVRYARGDAGWLWDLDAAYYSLMRRLPSPYPLLLADGRILWQEPSSEGWRRWRAVLDGVAGVKLLRNSLVGAALGAEGVVVVACAGDLRRVRPPSWGWASMGAVVVRTLYELTGAAVHTTQSVYANTDCVLRVDECAPPSVWLDAGLPCSLRAHGDWDVRGVGVYRVGAHATLPYRRVSCVPAVACEMVSAWDWAHARCWLGWLGL
jgi:hypothetical protein